MRKHRDIKLITTERKRNYLVSESNYHTTKSFTENLLAIEMRKTETLMNKPIYLGLTILHLIKTVMYEFWYDYAKPNIVKMKTFVIWIEAASLSTKKQNYFYKYIAEDIKTRFRILNKTDHCLKEKIKK